MWRSRFTKPEEIKRDSNGRASKEFFLKITLEEQPVENWPQVKETWGSMYKFRLVPVLRLKVMSMYRNVAGKPTGEFNTETLDKKKSVLQACGHAQWVVDRLFPGRHYALLLPGSWNGKHWSWAQYYAFWLVTSNGEDIPIVHDEKNGPWPFRDDQRLHFKILSPLERFTSNRGHLADLTGEGLFARMELRRRENEDGGSVVELRFAEGGETSVLMDTTKNPLATLVYALNDASGWREKLLCRTIVALRKELIKETTELRKGLDKETAKVKFWQNHLEDRKDRLEYLHQRISSFFYRAIKRFDATKSASRHRVFAEFRKFLECERSVLTRVPIEKSLEKRKADWDREAKEAGGVFN